MSAWTCPACGARNAAGAEWCTQCFRRAESRGAAGAGPTAPAPDPTAGAGPAPAGDDPPASAPRPVAGDAPAPAGSEGVAGAAADVRVLADGEVEWRCVACGSWNPLAAAACRVCASARTGFGGAPPARAAPDDAGRLVGWSLVVPGLGHALAGRVGTGVVRGLLGLGWLAGGLWLAVAAAGAGAGLWAALPLLAGAATVWVASALDARSLAAGSGAQRLEGRRLLWLVVAVTAGLLVALLADALRVASG